MAWILVPLEEGEGGAPRTMAYNLEEYQRAPDRTRALRCEVTLELRDPDDEGMPSDEEKARLKELSEILDGNVYHAVRGKYVMRVIGEGRQTHTFYIPDRKLGGLFRKRPATELVTAQIEELSEELDDYTLSLTLERDEEWDGYLDAFPSSNPMQYFKDLNALGALSKEGDDLRGPRPLTHSIYFEDAEAAGGFADELREAGFEATLEDEDEGGKLVGLAREEPDILIQNLHAVVLDILARVEAHGGEYDGWEAKVSGAPEAGDAEPGDDGDGDGDGDE